MSTVETTVRGAARAAADLAQDLRLAVRVFRRRPVFASVVVLTLGVGLGGATALFGVVDTVFRGAMPFGEGDRLLRLRTYSVTSEGDVRAYNMSPAVFHELRAGNRVFEEVIAMGASSLTLLGEGVAERVSAVAVSPGWSATLRVGPVMGRTFTADEEAAGWDAGVALLSWALWQSRFGGDPDVLTRSLIHEGGSLRIVGVMPRGFRYPYDADLWIPWRHDPLDWASHSLNVVGRMRPGMALEDVLRDAERLHEALQEASPATAPEAGIEVRTSREDFIREEARTLQALLLAVVFLLLLACANVANLLGVRFLGRRGELGVRAALGAGWGRVVRQLLTEILVLFLAGGVLGLALAVWSGPLLSVLIPDVLRTQLDLARPRVGGSVVGFALLLSLAAGLVFGGAAALRGSGTGLQTILREGARGSLSRSDRRRQDALVVAQLGLSLVLLVGAGALVRHFRVLQGMDLGFRTEDLFTLRITLDNERYAAPDARLVLLRTLEERIAAEPDVDAVGITTVNPLCCGDWGASIEIEGRPPSSDGAPLIIHHRYVTPGFFRAMGIPIVRGRGFDPTTSPASAAEVVVDEPLARRYWPGEDPVGKRLRSARDGAPWLTVVGVVPWVEKEGDYTASWYLPYYQDPTARSTENLHLMVRVRSESGLRAARTAVAEVDPGLGVWGVARMDELRSERLSQDRLGAVTGGLFAAFGLVLAAFGLYGLLSYGVELRSGEIGTRMAVGATRRDILRLVIRQALVRLVAGIAVGLPLALAVNRVLRAVVEDLAWVDAPTVTVLLALLVTVTMSAAALPALRASRTDPVRALRG